MSKKVYKLYFTIKSKSFKLSEDYRSKTVTVYKLISSLIIFTIFLQAPVPNR